MSMVAEMEMPVQETNVRDLVCEKLEAFDAAIGASENLEIDGIMQGNEEQGECLKIINHETKNAFAMSIDAIIEQPLEAVMEALKSEIFVRLQGVTRIVGFYSRISQWNSGKRAELIHRVRGNYWDGARVNSKETLRFVDKWAGKGV